VLSSAAALLDGLFEQLAGSEAPKLFFNTLPERMLKQAPNFVLGSTQSST
jgi:hypothetical protein